MFTLKWILENLIAPLVVALIVGILKQIFVQIVEHIKKRHFGVDMQGFAQYHMQAV